MALLAWSTFAVGGVYLWASVPAILGSLVLAFLVRPAISRRGDTRVLDTTLLVALGAILLQLVPLPASLLTRLDSHATGLRSALWFGLADQSASERPPMYPVTVNAPDTWVALALVGGAVLLFWTCRQVCEEGGARRIVRAVGVIGLLASVAALGQHAQSKELIYGHWKPLDEGARPFGPFVNRNHFATWVLMACPLVLGYVASRAHSHARRHSDRFVPRLVAALEGLGSMSTWLVTSACVMTLALLVSTSRSGVIGMAAAFLASAWLARQGSQRMERRWGVLYSALLGAVVLAFANLNAVLLRFDELSAVGVGGRSAIWRDTEVVIRDFWLTGTGLGTYRTAMLVYQQSDRMFFANQAHNQYLQLASEGGLLLVIPAVAVLLAFAALFRRRLASDGSSSFWLRVGAGAGLMAVAVQSFWETGLRMPANALLCAVLAAVAVHSSTDLASPQSSH